MPQGKGTYGSKKGRPPKAKGRKLLKGGQKKLDANKDGKIGKTDFAMLRSKNKPTPGTEAYRSLGASGARRMSGGQARGYTVGGGTGKAQLIGKIPRRPKSKHGKGMGTTGDKYKPKRSK